MTRQLLTHDSTQYTREALTKAAASASTMTEMLQVLGEEVTPGKRAHVWAKVCDWSIDTSHFTRSPRGSTGRRYTDEQLAAAVAASVSVAGVLRLLGIRPAGGSHFHISKRIKADGHDTSHFLGQAHYRGGRRPRKPTEEVLVVLPEGSIRTKHFQLKRAMLESAVPYVCAGCGSEPEWLGASLTLAIDHINGEWRDNRLENLRFLCPNCHSQTSTWCRQKSAL